MFAALFSMSSLKFIFPCKKLRRSQRLEFREKVEHTMKTINECPLGYFEILPLELKFLVLSYLPVEELSILTITSKAMRNTVEVFKNTLWAQQFLLPKPITHSTIPVSEQAYYCKQFTRLGVLMKRSSCLYATKDRLRLIQQFLQKYLCSFHKLCEDPSKCIALVCYGKFLHTVIAGWDDKECVKAFDAIGSNTLMLRNLSSIAKYKPAAYPRMELHVRLFFKRVFLSQCDSPMEKAFWLSLILKPFPMVHQARILFLLFGPVCGDEVQWYQMVESTPVNQEQAALCFSELASSFKVLHYYSSEWSEDDIISVIDELTSCPDEWLSENIAHLLYMCGDVITLKVLNSKAINGRVAELAGIIASLCLVCSRHSHPITWVTSVVAGICTGMNNPKNRLHFIHAIVDVFRETILEIHEYGELDEDTTQQEMHYLLRAQSQFTKEVITLATTSHSLLSLAVAREQ